MGGPEIEVPRGAVWSMCAVEYRLQDGRYQVHAEGESATGDTPEEAYASLRAQVTERRRRRP